MERPYNSDSSQLWPPNGPNGLVPGWSELTDIPPDHLRPPLDRIAAPKYIAAYDDRLRKITDPWMRDGVVILKNFIPDNLIDAYCKVRQDVPPQGWDCDVPYMHIPEIRDLCLYRPLMDVFRNLMFGYMGMHLNLTGWISTERNWHQDDYLNPAFVNGWYAAAWFALDNISPDSGPFQYIPGSHKWPVLRGDKLLGLFDEPLRRDRAWPSKTQDYVAHVCEEEIKRRGVEVVTPKLEKGDVLLWHSCLVHRGSKPKVQGMPRKAIITHYSTIKVRTDFPDIVKHKNDEYYFGINQPLHRTK